MSAGITRNRFDPFAGDHRDMFSLGTVSIQPKPPRQFPELFDIAYRKQPEPLNPRLAAYVNEQVIKIFGPDRWLGVDDVVARINAELAGGRVKVGRHYRHTLQSPETWQDAGIRARRWREYGIVVEEPGPDGKQVWRLVSREPLYVEEGKGRNRRVIKVRGLPPEEQAERYALEERRAKAARTYDKKARHRRQPEIDERIRQILTANADFLVPFYWAKHGFVDEALVGQRLDVAAEIARGAHHLAGLDRERLDIWIRCLGQSVCEARDAPRPTTIDLPDDDGAALDSLML